MVNDKTITLRSLDLEFSLPSSVGLLSPKPMCFRSDMLLPASKPRVVVSMVLSEDKTEIIETEEILYDDFDEEKEIAIIKQEQDCANLQNAALFKPRAIKREVSTDVETDINADNAEYSDWIIKNEEVHIKYEGKDEDNLQECSSSGSSQRAKDDEKHQMQQSRKGSARPSKKGRTLDQQIHYCPRCAYKTSSSTYFKRHMSIVHENGEGLKKYACSKCTFKTFYKQKLTQHIRRHDCVKVKRHTCSKCGHRTYRKKGLTDHICKKLEVLTCYDCGYQTVIKDQLRRHVLGHSHTKNFNCHVCSFRTKYKYSLNLHILRHNTNLEGFKKFKCTKCDYQSQDKSNLKTHSLVHMANKDVTKYSCTHCDLRTRYKSALKNHILLHMADKDVTTYSCNHCDFRTHHKQNLKRHVLLHNKRDYEAAKTLKCPECDYSTFLKFNLTKHQRTHNHK